MNIESLIPHAVTIVVSLGGSLIALKKETKKVQEKYKGEIEKIQKQHTQEMNKLKEEHNNLLEQIKVDNEQKAKLYESQKQSDVIASVMETMFKNPESISGFIKMASTFNNFNSK